MREATLSQVEPLQLGLEVDVQPVAASCRGVSRRRLNQPPANPTMLPTRVDGCVQQERVWAAVPANLHEAHQAPGIERAHPAQCVLLQAVAPGSLPVAAPEGPSVQRTQLAIVDTEARDQLNRHAATLERLVARGVSHC